MTPDLPPVLPGFSEPIYGNLKVPVKGEDLNNTDVALLNGINKWETGYFSGEGPGNTYSLRLGSAIARANGIVSPGELILKEGQGELFHDGQRRANDDFKNGTTSKFIGSMHDDVADGYSYEWNRLKSEAANGIGGEEIPNGLPPLPTVPDGFHRWEYRGKGYDSTIPCVYAVFFEQFPEDGWRAIPDDPEPLRGNVDAHYIEAVRGYKFRTVSCSQCGNDFGPGDHGFSHCADHSRKESESPKPDEGETYRDHHRRTWKEMVQGHPEPTPPNPESSNKELCQWLRDHSSGIYRKSACAADVIEGMESDLAAARAIFPIICESLGNGACCTADASIEFLSEIPNEVGLVIEGKDRDLKRLRSALEPFANGSLCASHSAVILGYGPTEAALKTARDLLREVAPASSGKGEG